MSQAILTDKQLYDERQRKLKLMPSQTGRKHLERVAIPRCVGYHGFGDMPSNALQARYTRKQRKQARLVKQARLSHSLSFKYE